MAQDVRTLFQKGVHVQNWSQTFECRPERYSEPEDVDQLKTVLEFARNNARVVRVIGYGHSPSDIAFTSDILVSMKKLNKILEVNKDLCRVTVEGGTMIDELNYHLRNCGLAFSVLPSVSNMTVGGAIATATHGSGMNYGTLSSYVVDLELLAADGSLLVCSHDHNVDIFRAAICGLGAIGIVVRLTLQVEPAFNLVEKHYGNKLEAVLSNLDRYTKASDHFKFLWYPHTDDVVICDISRVEYTGRAVRPVTNKARLWTKVLSWTSHMVELLYWISTFCSLLTPWINRFAYLLHKVPTEVEDISYNIFNFDCLFKQFVSDWAIPVEATKKAMVDLKHWLDTQDLSVVAHFPVEIRFTKRDDAYISPASGRDSCYINIIMYRPYGKDITKEKYWNAYERIMEEHGGRPHWAKEHKITAEKFNQMYPHFGDWCRVRKALDPQGIFVNDYLRRILSSKDDNYINPPDARVMRDAGNGGK